MFVTFCLEVEYIFKTSRTINLNMYSIKLVKLHRANFECAVAKPKRIENLEGMSIIPVHKD